MNSTHRQPLLICKLGSVTTYQPPHVPPPLFLSCTTDEVAGNHSASSWFAYLLAGHGLTGVDIGISKVVPCTDMLLTELFAVQNGRTRRELEDKLVHVQSALEASQQKTIALQATLTQSNIDSVGRLQVCTCPCT